jgi:hypothetical protein
MNQTITRSLIRRNRAPEFWLILCTSRLQTTEVFAEELWRSYQTAFPFTSQTVHFELSRMLSAAPHAVLEQRVQHLSRLVSPRDFLKASALVSPEGSHKRRNDVVKFEEMIMHFTDAKGEWKWP